MGSMVFRDPQALSSTLAALGIDATTVSLRVLGLVV